MPPDEAAKYCEENKVQRSVLRICLTAIERIRVKSLCKILWFWKKSYCGFTSILYQYFKQKNPQYILKFSFYTSKNQYIKSVQPRTGL